MYHPACWIVFSATTALLFIPGTGQGLLYSWADFEVLELERKGRKESPGGERECELHARGRGGLAVCTRAQSARSLTRTQMLAARDLLWCRQCDLVSWVRDLHCAVRRCCFGAGHRLALTSCGPRGRRRGVSTPNQKSFSPLTLRPAGEMGHPYFSVVVSQCQSLSLHLPMSLGFPPPCLFLCLFSLPPLPLPSLLSPSLPPSDPSLPYSLFSSFLSPPFSSAPEFLV